MTHQSPNQRRSPPSRPRHGSASRLPAPFRPPARATVRLLGAAGSGLAGLGLVIGAVTLVADVTALPTATHVSAAAGQRPALAYPARGGASPVGRAGHRPCCVIRPAVTGPRVLARFTGQGKKRTPPFTVAGTWQLEWSFSCAARRQPGRFVVRNVDGSTLGGTPVDQTGRRGHGLTAAYAGAGVRYLTIDSGCAWTMRVLTQG